MQNKSLIDGYKFSAASLCKELYEIIDKITEIKKLSKKDNELKQIDEMKDFLKSVYLDIESMTEL